MLRGRALERFFAMLPFQRAASGIRASVYMRLGLVRARTRLGSPAVAIATQFTLPYNLGLIATVGVSTPMLNHGKLQAHIPLGIMLGNDGIKCESGHSQ